MISLFKILSALPLWLLHAIGWALGWLVFFLSGEYRTRFLSNVRQAGLHSRDWRTAVGESGKMTTEMPRLWLGRPAPAQIEGGEHVQAALAMGKGVLFLTPHLGCFEITAQAYARQFGHVQPLTVLFRPPRKAWLRTILTTARERPGLLTASTTLAGVKQMIKALKKGQCVGLLPDQVPPMGMGLWAPFFGRDAYTMTLSVRLAQQTGATILLAWGERLPWGRGYRVHFEQLPSELPADANDAVVHLNRVMESLIARCPGQYMWGYARYKQPRQEV